MARAARRARRRRLRPRVAAIRSGSHPQPGEQVGGLRRPRRACAGPGRAASPTRRASRRRRVRRPAARRPGAGSPRAGAWSARPGGSAPTAPGSACRHRRRPAAGALGELADLGPGQDEDVVGDPPAGVGAADQRVAEPGDRARVSCARRGTPRRRRCPPELDDRRAGCRPAAAELHAGTSSRARSSPASRTAGQPARRRRQPEGGRHGVLGQGARDHRGVAGARSARPASRRRPPRPGRGAAGHRVARPSASARCRGRPGW